MELSKLNFFPNELRIYRLFEIINVETTDELIKYSEKDLLKYRNIGKTSINTIKNVLKKHNLYLSPFNFQTEEDKKNNINKFINEMENDILILQNKLLNLKCYLNKILLN